LPEHDASLVRERDGRGSTGLHLATTGGHVTTVRLLLEHGADPNARDRGDNACPLHFAAGGGHTEIVQDKHGHTPLASATLRGDREAMSRLHAAGARAPRPRDPSSFETAMAAIRDSVKQQLKPMLRVADVDATAAWYTSIGFELIARNPADENREMDWAMLSFGNSALMLTLGGTPGPHQASLWFVTDRIDDLYRLLKDRQLRITRAALAGEPTHEPEIRFGNDLYEPFYGGREFSIFDPNGFSLAFRDS
jgi:catechol 2,3-dioxygenase-like lactoylglutathione lyase family enzyme